VNLTVQACVRHSIGNPLAHIDSNIVEGVIRILDRPVRPNSSSRGATPDPDKIAAPWRVHNIDNNSPVELTDYITALEKALGKKACNGNTPPTA
jgi:hypothetical protein